MNRNLSPCCALCGLEKHEGDESWFLLLQNSWEDKVQVIAWDDRLTRKPSIFCACGPAHVEELVIHWMITGSLDYPFASSGPNKRSRFVQPDRPSPGVPLPISTQLIGELSVDRASVQRALNENPGSLGAILEELRFALDEQIVREAALLELEERPLTLQLLT